MLEQLCSIALSMLHKASNITNADRQRILCQGTANHLNSIVVKGRSVTGLVITTVVELLLKTACELNLVLELEELLNLADFNINQKLSLVSLGYVTSHNINDCANERFYSSSKHKTLLGIAAYHGHFETVEFLINKHNARVNAKDSFGNTALHQVVFGDSYPNIHDNNPGTVCLGREHEKVAKFLIIRGSELTIKNKKLKTAYDCMKIQIGLPFDFCGYSTCLVPGSSYFYRESLRKIFDDALARGPASKRLENAIHHYIQRNQIIEYYDCLGDIPKAIDQLNAADIDYIIDLLNFYMNNDLVDDGPGFVRNVVQTSALSLSASVLVAVITESILYGVLTGSLSAYFAYNLLRSFTIENRLAPPEDEDLQLSPKSWCKKRAQGLSEYICNVEPAQTPTRSKFKTL